MASQSDLFAPGALPDKKKPAPAPAIVTPSTGVKGPHVFRSAYFSPDGVYRMALTRCWNPSRPVAVVSGLNPSTADAFQDDPTISSISVQLDMMGYGTLLMLNAFAIKATDPKVMLAAADPVGPDNDLTWEALLCETNPSLFIAAWGRWGAHRNRDLVIMANLKAWGIQPMCFAVTMTGQPRHPLYLPHGATLIPYRGRK